MILGIVGVVLGGAGDRRLGAGHRRCPTRCRDELRRAFEDWPGLLSRLAGRRQGLRYRCRPHGRAQSLHQAVPDDGRPDAAAARVMSVMAEPVVYHRAPAFDALFARVLEPPPGRVPDPERRAWCSPPAARVRWSRRSPTSSRPGAADPRLRRREVRRALDRAGGGLRRRGRALRARLGRAARPRGGRPAARRAPGVEVVFATLSETSTGVVHDVRALAEAARGHGAHARRGRDLRPGGGRAAPGRVGHRRRHRRLAEGADEPARAGLRVGLAARARRRAGSDRAAATTSTGAAPSPNSARTRRPRRSPRPSRSCARSTSRSS